MQLVNRLSHLLQAGLQRVRQPRSTSYRGRGPGCKTRFRRSGRGQVRLVGVVHRADTPSSTPVLAWGCATWAWRTEPPRRLSGKLLACEPLSATIGSRATTELRVLRRAWLTATCCAERSRSSQPVAGRLHRRQAVLSTTAPHYGDRR